MKRPWGTWSRESLILEALDYEEKHGRLPSSYDWNPAMLARYNPGRAEHLLLEGWPSQSTVQRHFDGWAKFRAACEAAKREAAA